MRLIAAQPNYCMNAGVSYTCLSLMDQMVKDTDRTYWAYLFTPDVLREYSRAAVSRLAYRIATRVGLPESVLMHRLQRCVVGDVRKGDVVWIWPRYFKGFVPGVRARGAIAVTERVNTCDVMARRHIQAAYANLGMAMPAVWQDGGKSLAADMEVSREADAVFAPNPFVRDSLLEIGVPADRILDTSYGWSPERLAPDPNQDRPRDSRIRFLFVGMGCVRKGLPLLLRAWRDADIDGELLIAGSIFNEVRAVSGDLLAAKGVVTLGYVKDMAAVYHSADVFVFPTHEEGGPQVTFEAAGCGLALVVSPMGTGGGFRKDVDATVLDPFDHEAWVETFRRLDRDRDHLQRMKSAATRRAGDYTWEKVAARRLAMLQARFGKTVNQQ